MEDSSFDRLHSEIIGTSGESSSVFKILTNAYFVALTVILLSLFLWFPRKIGSDGNKYVEWDKFAIWYTIIALLAVYGLSKVNA
jgi:hypothetical protein